MPVSVFEAYNIKPCAWNLYIKTCKLNVLYLSVGIENLDAVEMGFD